MNNKKLRYSLITIIFFSLIAFVNVELVYAASNINVKDEDQKIILIDPGHGGFDGGASSSSGIKEKDINLNISLKLRDALRNEGYKVIMTREEDKALISQYKPRGKKAEDLGNRCRIKKESNCNLFISIHQNIFLQSQYHGAQVWYSQCEESKKAARIIQENLKQDLDKNNNRIEKSARDDYKILRCDVEIPSVLVECGFLSNVEEAEKLKTSEYQDQIVKSLVKSVNMYLGKK